MAAPPWPARPTTVRRRRQPRRSSGCSARHPSPYGSAVREDGARQPGRSTPRIPRFTSDRGIGRLTLTDPSGCRRHSRIARSPSRSDLTSAPNPWYLAHGAFGTVGVADWSFPARTPNSVSCRRHAVPMSGLCPGDNVGMGDVPEHTEDGRYVIIRGRRWRATDPAIPPDVSATLRAELMSARRAVGTALRADDPEAERAARDRVHRTKVALGERGVPWWEQTDDERRARWEVGPGRQGLLVFLFYRTVPQAGLSRSPFPTSRCIRPARGLSRSPFPTSR